LIDNIDNTRRYGKKVFKDLTGHKFGSLTVIERAKNSLWICQCDCGNTKIAANWQLRNKDTTSCGCRYNGPRVSAEQAVTTYLWDQYKGHAKLRGYDFDLSKEEVGEFVTSNCFYCGCPPNNLFKFKKKHKIMNYPPFFYNGIDRVDNNIGYLLDNCVSCCWMCNRAKGNFEVHFFKEWIDRVYEHLHKQDQA
jgi:hypothetical protein